MTGASVTTCSACGATGSGVFCSACGARRGGARCPSCGAALTVAARFCSSCGHGIAGLAARQADPPLRDRTPWVVAGISLAGMLGLLLFTLARQAPAGPMAPVVAAAGAGLAEESPPDLSSMSPRERFNRLYNRIMRGAEAGDQATVARFTPMALLAYAQLDTLDADARFHAALLRVHTGDTAAARALGDSVLMQSPGHLLGYVILGTAARWRKDEPAVGRAYAGFLKHYDAEMKAGRAEYTEHAKSISDFRRAALDTKGKPAAGK